MDSAVRTNRICDWCTISQLRIPSKDGVFPNRKKKTKINIPTNGNNNNNNCNLYEYNTRNQ